MVNASQKMVLIKKDHIKDVHWQHYHGSASTGGCWHE